MGHGKVKIGQTAFSASQVGTLYGCGFGTMLELYNKYKGNTGDLSEPTEEALKSMEFGTHFEGAVAEFFTYKTGLKVKKMGKGETAYWADDMPYFICHPDRIGIGQDKKGRRFALEIKCVRPYAEDWREEWTDEVPDYYYLQDQSYFACKVPCDVVYMAVLKGNRVYCYEIEPDRDVIEDIRSRVAKAKADFDADIIPDPANYDEANNYFRKKVDMAAEGIGANDEILEIYNEVSRLNADLKTTKDELEGKKAVLIGRLGTAPAFVVTEGKKIKKIAYWLEKDRSQFDDERFEIEHPDINLDDYKTTVKTREFRVSYSYAKESK